MPKSTFDEVFDLLKITFDTKIIRQSNNTFCFNTSWGSASWHMDPEGKWLGKIKNSDSAVRANIVPTGGVDQTNAVDVFRMILESMPQ